MFHEKRSMQSCLLRGGFSLMCRIYIVSAAHSTDLLTMPIFQGLFGYDCGVTFSQLRCNAGQGLGVFLSS